MTRFARAKGSKSSNLKAPDDSTPWEVMKEQLLQAKKESEENKNRQQAEDQRIENYSKFLKEQKVQKRKATWCEFPEAEKNKKAKDSASENNNVVERKKKTKTKNGKSAPEVNDNIDDSKQETGHENVSENPTKKKKKKNKNLNESVNSERHNAEAEVSTAQHEPITDKIFKKKQKKNKKENKNDKSVFVDNQENKQTTNNINDSQQKKKKKKKGDKPTRRKEINDKSFQLIINGKEVELMRFDGFPIMKKDADRLSELKSSMIKKGIPKSEVNRTIKLERRRAEKALARLKRDVCYNCRKGGHNLSDCPELKSNIPGVDAADGVCFKCGSTEHRQFECKVQRDKEFRFANCFICKEQGHIARQCPDNPKGLYPNGGCCKLCGDVTHLRKDCPTDGNKKEGTAIKLQTLDMGSNIEDIDLQSKPNSEEAPKNKKPKKIKF